MKSAFIFICMVSLFVARPASAANTAGDLALNLAQQLNIAAGTPEEALAALQAQGIIPAGVAVNAPITAAIAQTVSAGLITSGQSPAAAAQVIATSAAAVGVPVNVVVQGAIQAATAVGANVAAVAQAATQGAVQGAQAAGVDVVAVAQAASSGAVQGAQAAGVNVAAIVQASSAGAVQGAQAADVSVAALVTGHATLGAEFRLYDDKISSTDQADRNTNNISADVDLTWNARPGTKLNGTFKTTIENSSTPGQFGFRKVDTSATLTQGLAFISKNLEFTLNPSYTKSIFIRASRIDSLITWKAGFKYTADSKRYPWFASFDFKDERKTTNENKSSVEYHDNTYEFKVGMQY